MGPNEIHVDDLIREDFTCDTCDKLACPARWSVINVFGNCAIENAERRALDDAKAAEMKAKGKIALDRIRLTKGTVP